MPYIILNKHQTCTPCKIFISTIILCIYLTLATGCSKEETDNLTKEKQAQTLVKKAEYLTATGKQIEALKLYDRLAEEFSGTETKKRIENKMLKEGISIGSSLSSYTARNMIMLENRINAYKKRQGRYPYTNEVVQPMDAWGNTIYFKLFPNKKNYDLIIYSNGPDKKAGTEDDRLIVKQKNKDTTTQNTGAPLSTSEIDMLSDNIDIESADSSELILSVNDINKVVKDKNDTAATDEIDEIEVSLKELLNQK